MINTSPKVLLLESFDRNALHFALELYAEMVTVGEAGKQASQRGIEFVDIISHTTTGTHPSSAFIQLLPSLGTASQSEFFSKCAPKLYATLGTESFIDAFGWQSFRHLAKFLLFRLWADGTLMVPIWHTFGTTLSKEITRRNGPELYRFCVDYDDPKSASSSFRMNSHVPRWLYSTSWTVPESIDISEVPGLFHFHRACNEGTTGYPVGKIQQTLSFFLREILVSFPHRVQFGGSDLAQLELYFSDRFYFNFPYVELDDRIRERGRLREITKHERRVHLSSRPKRGMAPANQPEDPGDLVNLVKNRTKRSTWFPDSEQLPFLDSVMTEEARSNWSNLFDEYLTYRENVRGFEQNKTPRSALRTLADYLAIALPAAAFDNPLSTVLIPDSPRLFLRTPYIYDSAKQERPFPTFIKFLDILGNGTDTKYAKINAVLHFFDFIEANYTSSDDQAIAGPEFRNPLHKSDLPRVVGIKNRTTNKVPFSRHLVPHLINWLYLVELFGMRLQSMLPSLRKFPANISLDAKEFGVDLRYTHLGEEFVVSHVPIDLVRFDSRNGQNSISAIRMIIVALETGLRLQSVQWLCQLTFNKYNTEQDNNSDDVVKYLWVNTDKVHNGFRRPILKRVYDCLMRELDHQQSLGVEDFTVLYEGREATRFPEILPLFRNPETNQPLTDAAYQTTWLSILLAFERYYSGIVEYTPLVKQSQPKNARITRTPEGFPFCALKISPIHTPHSCRSTYISLRSAFLSLEDLAAAVGHKSAAVTAIYVHPTDDVLGAKLRYADSQVGRSEMPPAPIVSGPAYVKASEVNSTMQMAFRKDRDNAISDFAFFSLSNHEADVESAGGIDLLRSSPMSNIVFRDTHICPVGEMCPTDILPVIREGRRCGACPIACKSVDHLPAIGAKIRELTSRIDHGKRSYAKVKSGPDKSALGEIYSRIDIDTHELLGWAVSEKLLTEMLENEDFSSLYVGMPDIVRLHLQRVSGPSTDQEFLLARILDSDAFPVLETPELAIQSEIIRRQILSKTAWPEEELVAIDCDYNLLRTASLLRTIMAARGWELSDLAKLIETPLTEYLSSQPIKLLGLADQRATTS
ncbi:hypothetical protein [Sphingomonas sp. AX6]|uniref:hypothetical protein n=1 Tax=Sphingomonas sp. AX6 TaxID=2653171 RepID=UPI0012F00FAC|nr:hypothetical protein [Sphingomonas sp. AX6]VXC96289.1 conserved hypothetical protein [Sphingomonas sp. AX6]